MKEYLITSTISSVILLGFYLLLLEKEKTHRFKRYYLLFSLVFSLVLPFVSIEILKENTNIQPAVITINTDPTLIFLVPETNHWPQLLLGIYGIVTLMISLRFIKNITAFYNLKKANHSIPYHRANLVLLLEPVLPHTFMNIIFVNKDDYEQRKIENELFTHELTHVNQKHTLDVLFVEILKTLYWFNPIFIFYKKAIQLNHEFLADEKVVDTYENVSLYQSLLLLKANNNQPYYLASNLNFQITKKRFIMMTKNTSKQILLGKKIALLPVFTALFYTFCIETVAQEKTITTPKKAENIIASSPTKGLHKKYSGKTIEINTAKQTSISNNKTNPTATKPIEIIEAPSNNPLVSVSEEIYNTTQVTEAPNFPGGMEKFYAFVGENFNTPEQPNLKGKIFLTFIVEKDGSLSEFKILRDIGFGTGEEAMRVMKLSPKWIPAKQDGQIVRVKYSLPISIQTAI